MTIRDVVDTCPPAPWLTPEIFRRSHFELGSGTSLQPLLWFSDRVTDFLFVDFDPDVRAVQRHLLRELRAVEAAEGAPLRLVSLEVHPSLSPAHFATVHGPGEVWRRLGVVLTAREREGYDGFRAMLGHPRAGQWGLTARLERRVARVDGEAEVRPLTLRMVGGEGLLAYVAMGGMESAPPSFGTVQTGLGEVCFGPVARLFAQQAVRGAPVPGIWVRGMAVPSWFLRSSLQPVMDPAPPFDVLGQCFSHWISDRTWPDASDPRRAVRAWLTAGAPAPGDLALGPHRFTAAPLTAGTVRAAGAACLPARLARRLGVADLPHVLAVEPPRWRFHRPLASVLRAWRDTRAFREAGRAVLVPAGFGDELGAIVDWVGPSLVPAVSVHLPLPLDLEAAHRAARRAR